MREQATDSSVNCTSRGSERLTGTQPVNWKSVAKCFVCSLKGCCSSSPAGLTLKAPISEKVIAGCRINSFDHFLLISKLMWGFFCHGKRDSHCDSESAPPPHHLHPMTSPSQGIHWPVILLVSSKFMQH